MTKREMIKELREMNKIANNVVDYIRDLNNELYYKLALKDKELFKLRKLFHGGGWRAEKMKKDGLVEMMELAERKLEELENLLSQELAKY